MCKFIEVTNASGDKFLINTNNITMVNCLLEEEVLAFTNKFQGVQHHRGVFT